MPSPIDSGRDVPEQRPDDPPGSHIRPDLTRGELLPGTVSAVRHVPPRLFRRWRGSVVYVAVFAVAFSARFLVAQVSGGFTRVYISYDAAVYYAAADALTFGRLPYRDFVFLHPPGLLAALTPFALLGRFTDDRLGFMVAVFAFTTLGAVNAVLTCLVCTRMGMSRAVSGLGGLFYAIWLGSAQAEYQIRLEPLGNLFVLLGLLAYLSSRRSGHRWAPFWAGAAFATAASVKIWWAAPLVVLICWHLRRRHRAIFLRMAAGAAAALAAVNVPFAIAAPRAMWHMVVIDQLFRPKSGATPVDKARGVTGFDALIPNAPPAVITSIVPVAFVILLTVVLLAWRLALARLAVVILVAQVVVLLASPSWFVYYPDYLAPTAAVVLAGAVAANSDRGLSRRIRFLRWVPIFVVLGAASVTARFVVVGTGGTPRHPSATLTAAVADVRCLMSDSPSGLILLDALSRSLHNGCPNWIDVTGRLQGVNKEVGPDGRRVPPVENEAWQRDLLAYLTSGDAVFLIRTTGTGLSDATLEVLRSEPVLAQSGTDVVYRTTHRYAGPPR